MNPYRLFLEFLFGLVGMAYIVYGKKQGNMVALACGLGLGVFPYFVENAIVTVILGACLVLAPFLSRNR